MTKAQEKLKAEHGTPEEFDAACWLACCDLFITVEEYRAAVAKYQSEWERAGRS